MTWNRSQNNLQRTLLKRSVVRLYVVKESGQFSCKGFSFIGGKDDSHIELVMEESDDRVKDIYHCNIFSYSEGKPPKGPRIQLYDDDDLPF